MGAAGWEAIGDFARTFDGYEYWGSFDRCAEIANAQRGETLTELRTCLFFEQRRWHHFGDYPNDDAMRYVRGIIECIRAIVEGAASSIGTAVPEDALASLRMPGEQPVCQLGDLGTHRQPLEPVGRDP